MTTITFEEDIKLDQKNFKNIQDFMEKVAYEEQLEEKMQLAQKASDSDFLNL